ncbi:hypothetical protein M514_02840 [Trichuris suis]|uniref:Uncharacterized protein n=1 Tax=Trichuris suis TaxID=68888 RepID=A0A085NEQ4_9BILA|nr:hypothetical protein M513_02840 [Trichuris suis]KFD67950.1 hypothetical protein M514_02840 [Trichuris suis]
MVDWSTESRERELAVYLRRCIGRAGRLTNFNVASVPACSLTMEIGVLPLIGRLHRASKRKFFLQHSDASPTVNRAVRKRIRERAL